MTVTMLESKMGHHISGIVAARVTLEALGAAFGHEPPIDLALGMAFVPLDDSNVDRVIGPDPGEPVGKFEYLTARLIELLCRASRAGVLIYVETEYFGGSGAQGAAVFRGGEIALPPRQAKSGIIDEALERAGIEPGPGDFDRFDTLRLGDFRDNDDWRSGKRWGGVE